MMMTSLINQVRDRGGIPGQVVKGRASSTLRFGKERLAPHLQSLLVALFGILERPGYDHADNEYVMKAHDLFTVTF